MTTAGRRRAWPWVLLFAAIGLAALFYGVGGWYFAGQVHREALEAVPSDPIGREQGTVVAVRIEDGRGSITLMPDTLDPQSPYRNAVVGLAVGESLVVAGPAALASDGGQVREVRDLVGDPPPLGVRYGLARDVWLTPEQAGLDDRDIKLATLDGQEYPAWLIPGRRAERWAILTHGKGEARSEMLRLAQPLHRSGYNVLVLTHQGDVGAPPYEDGMVTYGRVEWTVVEAAVEFAGDRGAERIVLGGAGHGGAVTLGFLARSRLAGRVDGVILDAPVSSFEDVLDEAAEFRTLPVVGLAIPESLEEAAQLIVAFRYGVNFRAVNYTDQVGLIDVPLLTFQGTEDRTVAKPVNDRFMSEGSGRDGEYVIVPGAGHGLAWNVDPEAYEEQVREFLRSL